MQRRVKAQEDQREGEREGWRRKEIVIKMARSSDLYQTAIYHTAAYGGCALSLDLTTAEV
jgi:hypothetical protein